MINNKEEIMMKYKVTYVNELNPRDMVVLYLDSYDEINMNARVCYKVKCVSIVKEKPQAALDYEIAMRDFYRN